MLNELCVHLFPDPDPLSLPSVLQAEFIINEACCLQPCDPYCLSDFGHVHIIYNDNMTKTSLTVRFPIHLDGGVEYK